MRKANAINLSECFDFGDEYSVFVIFDESDCIEYKNIKVRLPKRRYYDDSIPADCNLELLICNSNERSIVIYKIPEKNGVYDVNCILDKENIEVKQFFSGMWKELKENINDFAYSIMIGSCGIAISRYVVGEDDCIDYVIRATIINRFEVVTNIYINKLHCVVSDEAFFEINEAIARLMDSDLSPTELENKLVKIDNDKKMKELSIYTNRMDLFTINDTIVGLEGNDEHYYIQSNSSDSYVKLYYDLMRAHAQH